MQTINCWALLVSALVSVVLGMLWYGPLFGKQWMALSGILMPDPKPSMKVMIKPMIISVIGAFLMANTLFYSIVFAESYLHVSGIGAALQGAFWNWLGFIVPVTLAPTAWEGKSWKLFLLNAGYWLVLLGIMAIILTMWV